MLDYLFPRQCLLCGELWDYLCKECKKQMKPHPELCPYCHKFSSHYQTCLDCKSAWKKGLEWIIIPFVYTENIKRLILKLKYFHKKDIAEFLSQRLVLAFQMNQILQKQSFQKKKIYISWVPSHWFRKYFIKWYNQSEILAKKFAQQSGLTYIKIAKKKKHTKSQARLGRQKRLSNLKNCFQLEPGFQPSNKSWSNIIIILLDDITTSWATLDELARTIKQKYPDIMVWGIVVGRHAW